jgi:hypothetical protein
MRWLRCLSVLPSETSFKIHELFSFRRQTQLTPNVAKADCNQLYRDLTGSSSSTARYKNAIASRLIVRISCLMYHQKVWFWTFFVLKSQPSSSNGLEMAAIWSWDTKMANAVLSCDIAKFHKFCFLNSNSMLSASHWIKFQKLIISGKNM